MGDDIPGGFRDPAPVAALLPAGAVPISRRSIVLVVSAAGLVALCVGPVLSLVAALGHNFASSSAVPPDYVLGLYVAVILGVTLLVWPIPLRDRLALLGLWTLKIGIVLGFMLVYESYYDSLDAFYYYHGANDPTLATGGLGLGRGTENIVAAAWWVARLLPRSYHALKVVWAMVGLLAIYLFYRAASEARGKRDLRLLVVLALTPSILFWSSILGKDPISLLGIGMYALGVVHFHRRPALRFAIVAALGLTVAAAMRIWLVPILLAPLVVLGMMSVRRAGPRLAVVLLGLAVVASSINVAKSLFLGETASDLVAVAGSVSQMWAEGGSAQKLDLPMTGPADLLAFLPLGIATALFRPLPGEVNNAFGLVAGLENMVVVILLLAAIVRSGLRDLADPLVAWAIALVLVWAAVYGFISYQNLGTAVRFRLQIFPTLLLLLLHLSRSRRPSARVTAFPIQ